MLKQPKHAKPRRNSPQQTSTLPTTEGSDLYGTRMIGSWDSSARKKKLNKSKNRSKPSCMTNSSSNYQTRKPLSLTPERKLPDFSAIKSQPLKMTLAKRRKTEVSTEKCGYASHQISSERNVKNTPE